ncbi:unnamed protein product, partial [Discosporangium mesarthrocarpum]
LLWGVQLEGIGREEFLAVAVEQRTGDIFAAGYTTQGGGGMAAGDMAGGSDSLVTRLSGEDGMPLWRATRGSGFGDPISRAPFLQDSARGVAVDREGSVLVCGHTEGALYSPSEGGRDTDAFVARLNGTDGTRTWGWQTGDPLGNDYANAVAVDHSTGAVYVCGSIAGGGGEHGGGKGAGDKKEGGGTQPAGGGAG